MLKRFLPNVLEYSRKDATVYVADNASTDDSLEILKQRFPEVRLVLLEKNWACRRDITRLWNRLRQNIMYC